MTLSQPPGAAPACLAIFPDAAEFGQYMIFKSSETVFLCSWKDLAHNLCLEKSVQQMEFRMLLSWEGWNCFRPCIFIPWPVMADQCPHENDWLCLGFVFRKLRRAGILAAFCDGRNICTSGMNVLSEKCKYLPQKPPPSRTPSSGGGQDVPPTKKPFQQGCPPWQKKRTTPEHQPQKSC